MAKQAYPVANQIEKMVADMQSKGQNGVFDSAATYDSAMNHAPEFVREFAQSLPVIELASGQTMSGSDVISKAILDGVNAFQSAHGYAPDSGIIAAALQAGRTAVDKEYRRASGLDRSAVWDDASGISGSPMVANIAQIAIYQTIAEAIPFAGYIPMTDGTKGKIIIANHRAATAAGDYAENETLNGVNAGKNFMSNQREVVASGSGTTFTATIKHAKGDSQGATIVPHTIAVYVNGLPAAQASSTATREQTTVAFQGEALSNGKMIAVTGSANRTNGAVSLTFAKALQSTDEVVVVANIDYEVEQLRDKRPTVEAAAKSYDITANTYSGKFRVTPEAKAQWSSEVRLSAEAEAAYILRQQSNAERHFEAIRAMYRVGKNYVKTFDMKSAVRLDERSRSSIFEDALGQVYTADIEMVERTDDFGIGVIYVGAKGKEYFEALDNDVFVKSGNATVAGIHRIGTLRGRYQVYYAPNVVKETADAFEILCIGKSDKIGLNPYVIGDVTGAIMIPLAAADDLSEGMGFFQMGVSKVNPHLKSAQGAAIVQITNAV